MLNDAFKALSDPTRRRILELLTEGDLTAGEGKGGLAGGASCEVPLG